MCAYNCGVHVWTCTLQACRTAGNLCKDILQSTSSTVLMPKRKANVAPLNPSSSALKAWLKTGKAVEERTEQQSETEASSAGTPQSSNVPSTSEPLECRSSTSTLTNSVPVHATEYYRGQKVNLDWLCENNACLKQYVSKGNGEGRNH